MVVIRFEWEDFQIDLVSLEKHLRDTYTSYVGNSADTILKLYFEDDSLTDQEIQDIKDHWASLDEATEAAKRALPSRSQESKEALLKAEKEAILLITDFSTLTELQKKIWMGLELTNDEIDSLAQ